MAVRTHDGKQVKKVWNKRRLEEWKDDIRQTDKVNLVFVTPHYPPVFFFCMCVFGNTFASKVNVRKGKEK